MAATSADRYRFDDWSLEPSEARLLKAGEPVAIEPRAFDVLAYFLANPLRLVTKEELLEHAWPGVAVSDNALTRAIARLRKVLEDDARAPRYLETVHSRGYRFRVQPEIESRERGKIARASEEMESPSPGRPRAPGRRRAAVSAALALALVAALGGWRLIRLPGGEKLD
ncbi:MAG: transcriptional regulator, partial [Acidobacteriota bacterium]